MRTFLAIELPEIYQEDIRGVQERLKERIKGVKWVKADNVHLTLKFLGEITEAQAEEICRVTSQVTRGHVRFPVQLKGVGVFPDLRRPRVIFLALSQGEYEVVALEKELSDSLEKIGFPREKRAFHPHFTVGRFKALKPGGELSRVVADFSNYQREPFVARGVTLFKSELRPEGAQYTRLAQFELGGEEDAR